MLKKMILKFIFGEIGEFLWVAGRELSSPARKDLIWIVDQVVRDMEIYNVDLGEDRRRIAGNSIRLKIWQLGLPIDPGSHLVNLAIELAVAKLRNP